MCNACAFHCCAWDGSEGCGCESCPNPQCWLDEEDDEDFYDDWHDEE